MNYVDTILIVAVIFSVLAGLSRGLISQLIDLVSYVFSLALAFMFANAVGHWIDRFFALPNEYITVIGFMVVLFGLEGIVQAILRFIGHFIPGILTASLPNRLLGIIPALASLTLTATLIFTAINTVPRWTATHEAVKQSKLAPIFIQYGSATESLVKKVLGTDLTKY